MEDSSFFNNLLPFDDEDWFMTMLKNNKSLWLTKQDGKGNTKQIPITNTADAYYDYDNKYKGLTRMLYGWNYDQDPNTYQQIDCSELVGLYALGYNPQQVLSMIKNKKPLRVGGNTSTMNTVMQEMIKEGKVKRLQPNAPYKGGQIMLSPGNHVMFLLNDKGLGINSAGYNTGTGSVSYFHALDEKVNRGLGYTKSRNYMDNYDRYEFVNDSFLKEWAIRSQQMWDKRMFPKKKK